MSLAPRIDMLAMVLVPILFFVGVLVPVILLGMASDPRH
jgi:hypothetical protein